MIHEDLAFANVALATICICAAVGQPSATPAMTDIAAARFLDQATWGPTPASIAQLQQMGISNWLTARFLVNASDLAGKNDIKPPRQLKTQNIAPVQAAFFGKAVTGQDQLRQRIAFALSQMWACQQYRFRAPMPIRHIGGCFATTRSGITGTS